MGIESKQTSEQKYLAEIAELRARLFEAEETLQAIHSGEVDAIVVSHKDSDKIFTLVSADTPYRIIVEQMNEGAVTLSAEGVIVFCNQRFQDLFSLPSEKILGSYFSDFVIAQDKEKFDKLFHHGLSLKCEGEIRLANDDDQWVYMNLLLSPMPEDMHGDICILFSDITKLKIKEIELSLSNEELEHKVNERTAIIKQTLEELKTTNEHLAVAKLKAEESDRLKSSFLANMSHEIRTPLNGILGFTELLKTPHLSANSKQKYLSLIEKGGMRLLGIINDLIDISRIESGLTTVVSSQCNIKEQVEYVYNLLKPEVVRKGMQMTIQLNMSESESLILSDREKIYAILTNLVKNAIKYSNKGTIDIGCNLRSAKVNKEILFSIKDTGIGIPKEKQEIIFNRFEQVDSEHTQKIEGTGLGLSIAKAYVELLGGNIWVESEPGLGSTFYFTLPYTVAKVIETPIDDNTANEIKFQQVKKLKILIVEDDETSAMLLELILKDYCSGFLYAESGLDAVNIYKKNPDIDLIMMDLNLPIMSGFEATRQIRAMSNEVIIISQSAHIFESDIAKAMKCGCNGFIEKPLKRTMVNELLLKHFS